MDNQPNLIKRKFLLPGEYYASKIQCEIATLLGSCVSVCLYDNALKVAAMNHYLLDTEESGAEPAHSARYGSYAIPHIFDLMMRFGSNKKDITAQIFGGGIVVKCLDAGNSIGTKNIEFAQSFLKQERIPITREDVGGNFGRKIWFNSETGNVKRNLIEKVELESIEHEKLSAFSKKRIRVLVVDDDPLLQKLISRVISSDPKFLVVATASDAYEAREKITELKPDVMTLDVVMPRMSGIKFLNKVMMYMPIPTAIMVSTH